MISFTLKSWFRALADRSQRPSGSSADSLLPDASLPPSTLSAEDVAECEAGGLNFYTAIHTHQAWKRRLLQLVQGDAAEALDPDHVGRDDCCELGAWLHASPPVPARERELFERVVAQHARFHRLAAEMVRRIQRGDGTQAQAEHELTRGEYARVSRALIADLGMLYLVTSGDTSGPRS